MSNTAPTAPARSEIWLIRHGETEWSRSGQHTGRTDMPLTEYGREQARQLKPLLANQHFDSVFSSPLSRALETCREAGLGERVVLETDLLEWDYGVYDGRTTKEIRDETPDWSVWHSPIPKGESLLQIQTRAQTLIRRLLVSHAHDVGHHFRIALFSHAHFLRVFAACWIADSAAMGAHFTLDTASISVLGFDHDNRAIRQWNARHP